MRYQAYLISRMNVAVSGNRKDVFEVPKKGVKWSLSQKKPCEGTQIYLNSFEIAIWKLTVHELRWAQLIIINEMITMVNRMRTTMLFIYLCRRDEARKVETFQKASAKCPKNLSNNILH